ncbi:hypothetical protein [Allosphingosinicella deserti]|uniref:Uncharacterized protein n=1 Tax=Allosphingosinicella deserti TaxID=2116704 RepID=A0A2P7QF17_9SPHN|nr:hypothetical protein [Sphingomonas deserti]PSJ36559.1 hypothetical protein C7I55_26200 [Sphingomonas deserti]
MIKLLLIANAAAAASPYDPVSVERARAQVQQLTDTCAAKLRETVESGDYTIIQTYTAQLHPVRDRQELLACDSYARGAFDVYSGRLPKKVGEKADPDPTIPDPFSPAKK